MKTQMVERPDGSCQLNLLDMASEPAIRTPEVDVFAVRAENLPRLETKVLQAECEEVDDEEDQDDAELLHMGAHCVFHGAERKQLLKQLHDIMTVRAGEELTIMEVFRSWSLCGVGIWFWFQVHGFF